MRVKRRYSCNLVRWFRACNWVTVADSSEKIQTENSESSTATGTTKTSRVPTPSSSLCPSHSTTESSVPKTK